MFRGGGCGPRIAVGHGLYSSIGDFIRRCVCAARRGEEQEQLRARLFRVQGQLKKSLEDIEDISQLTGVPRTGATLPAS